MKKCELKLNNVNKIKLQGGKVSLVDSENYEFINKFKWRALKTATGEFRATTSIKINGSYKTVYMHRLIFNPDKHQFIDHVNGDSLDNRKSNLRIASHAENIRNSSKHRVSSSKFKGVYKATAGKKWRAEITYNKRRFYLGKFSDEELAAKEYDKASKKYFKQFARLNFK